jgi:hypothetical protein
VGVTACCDTDTDVALTTPGVFDDALAVVVGLLLLFARPPGRARAQCRHGGEARPETLEARLLVVGAGPIRRVIVGRPVRSDAGRGRPDVAPMMQVRHGHGTDELSTACGGPTTWSTSCRARRGTERLFDREAFPR